MTIYGLDGPGFGPLCKQASFLNTFRPALVTTQPPVLWIPGPGGGVGHLTPSDAEVRHE